MTLRNASLTAVAALTVALAGGAVAQDTSTAPGTTAPVGSSYHTGGSAAPAPTAAEPAAPEAAPAPVAEAPAPTAEAPAAAAPASPEATTTAAMPEPTEAEPAEAPAETPAPAAEQPVEAAVAEAPAAATPAPAETEAPAAAEPEHAAAAEGEHAAAGASHAAPHIEDISFSFEGPFGSFDQFQLQRGLQVYTEVCSACHGLRYVPLRTLGDPGGPGLPEDQVRAYAANLDITDAETGEDRPRVPTDHFPTNLAEGMGPDLSLMAKARAGFHGPYGTGITQFFRGIGGPEYIHAILTGYNGETKEEAGSTFYHNAAFSTGWIKMPQPLTDGQVTYEDGTEASVDQMARDVSAFLMWTAEPKMMDRKQVGMVSVLFLIVLASLLYLTNKKLWWPIKHGRKAH
ncbi:cytochrome c1 [Paracoccus aestuariivivens]|uniref:Cytochrome c1 n=1 Tax=Paracoccus aestuariivivens TaxID=1820333 RepID=A0A6L6J5X2_9RHOB|nr:cytochrome c1 [Paracoccus aestuariivivens]MTH76638.1 cytochrome c1 [Paracoccus aestuariivivens]